MKVQPTPKATLRLLPASAKWAWHQRTLLEFRERLMKERAERLSTAAQPIERFSQSQADSASDEFDHDLALSQLTSEDDWIHQLDAALDRIQQGTYGVCQQTGRPITPARLRAVPWALYSKDVQLEKERRGETDSPHLGTLGSVRPGFAGEMLADETEDEPAASTDETLQVVPTKAAPGKKPSPIQKANPRRARKA